MKTIYKLLIVGMLYLISNTTYAQIVQYSDDGTKSCIDCEEKTGTASDCFCYFFEDVPRFHEVLAKIEAEKREEWLRGKEKILKDVIEDRLHTTYTSYPEAQRAFFKKYSAELYSESILNNLENNVSSSQRPKEIEKNKNHYAIRTIKKLFQYNNEGTAYKFGDLKMNGKYLKDIPNQEAVQIHMGLDNKRKEIAYQLVGISRILKGIPKIRQNKALEERVLNDFMNHYNGHDFPNRVLLMAKYLIWQNNGHIVGNNPANDPYPPSVFNPNLYDYQSIARDLALNAGQPISISYPPVTDDQAIAFYAMSTFGDNEYNFMMETAQENLRGATQGYLENYQYDTSALGRTNNAIRKYVNNETAYNSFDNYVVAGSGTTSNVDLGDGANHVYRWKFNSNGENNGLVGVSNFFYELFKLDENHYELEGSIFRNMFNANSVDVGNLSNHDLGRLFDFSTVYPYGEYKYDIFFDYFSLSDQEVANFLIEKETIFYADAGGKKVNPKEETKCFDLTKPAKVTIYVEQPIEGSREITAYVGHTFVGIEQGGISRYLGYYPKNQMPSLISDQVAEIHDNSGAPYHVSISTEVSSDQLKRIINHIVDFPETYFLNTYNCSDFGIDIGRRAGINLPKTIGQYKQLFFKFEGRNPSDLGEDIRVMNSTPKITIEKTGGNAPTKKGGC
ncbi:hypothetical protein [Aquimarina macrocephali]|uniref:hypothetical protein n=1 Tax=Aquimarina macrocephali TaxID=666563 RepID=UPI003F66BA1C